MPFQWVTRLAEIVREDGVRGALDSIQSFFLWRIDPVLRSISSRYFQWWHGPGIDVMSRDWDVLILLDACRCDYFEPAETLDGTLDSVVSRGAHSWEFMKGNFEGRDLHDTVYVTANPHIEKLDKDVFYTVENVLDQWEDDIGTVMPEVVTDAAIKAGRRYPDKRLIVHYMQPHQPHLGPTADAIRERLELCGWDKYIASEDTTQRSHGVSIWRTIRDGETTLEEVRQAYSETLEVVLEEAETVADTVSGKTVVSADHGEMLGERGVLMRRFGHPHDIYNRELRAVPWFTIEDSERRTPVAEEPIGFDRLESAVVDERLTALGYRPG